MANLSRRDFLKTSAIAGAGALAVACAPSTSGGAAAPKVDTSKLVIALDNLGAQNWEPYLTSSAEDSIREIIGDPLIAVDPVTRAMKPGLAESWSQSADGKTWTFKLRANVPFHGGYGMVTAEDVQFSWDQYNFHPKSTRSSGAILMKQAIDGKMANFKIISPLEFSLTTPGTPAYDLDDAISARDQGMVVQSKKYWTDKPTEALNKPIGTGPYQFISSTPGVEVVLEALPSHWRTTPVFKQLIIKPIADGAARLAQVQSGGVDLSILTADLAVEAAKNGVKVRSVKDVGTLTMVLGGMYPEVGDPAIGESAAVRNNPAGASRFDRKAPWIQADTPAKGLAVRQALSLAIDRKAILEKILAGEGSLSTAPVSQYASRPLSNDASWKVPEYNVTMAKAKLAEGGYPTGFDIEVVLYENRAGTGADKVAEAVAGMWEAIGIKVKRRPSDQTTERPKLQNRTTNGTAYCRIVPFYQDPAGALISVHPTGPNPIAYDPFLTKRFRDLLAERDEQKHWAIAREMMKFMIDNVTVIPLFSANQAWATSGKIGDWAPMASQAVFTNPETIAPPK